MKKMVLLIGIMLVSLFVNCGVFANNTHSLAIQVNGQTVMPAAEIMVNADTTILLRADPEATAVRFYHSGHCPDPDDNECWLYYDRNAPLTYLEIHEKFGFTENNDGGYIVAQARYDNYANGLDFWHETWTVSPWEVQTNEITLNLNTISDEDTFISAALDKDTVAPGEFLTASIDSLGIDEHFWADLYPLIDGEPDWEARMHFDYNDVNELAIPILGFEPGKYLLVTGGFAPGYRDFLVTNNEFTVTSGTVNNPAFIVNKTKVIAGESIFFGLYAEDAVDIPGLELTVTKDGEPTWFGQAKYASKSAGEPLIVHGFWNFSDSGTYQMVLTDKNREEIARETITVTSEGRLSIPDLSGLPGLLPAGNYLNGNIVVDPDADSIEIKIYKTFRDWIQVYRSVRQDKNGDWNIFSVPADLLTEEGVYCIEVNTGSRPKPDGEGGYLNYDGVGTRMMFVVGDLSGVLQLTVDGSSADIDDSPSSKQMTIEARSTNPAVTPTAIRFLKEDGWWEFMDAPDGTASWNRGFGAGDYTLIAQMTTESAVWRDEDFDWSGFSWENLNWEDFSNPVKLHVTSNGQLEAPEISLDSSEGVLEEGIYFVKQGDVLTVTITPQDKAGWSWAELRMLFISMDDPYDRRFETVEYGHFDCDSDWMTLTIPTIQLRPGYYWLVVGLDGVGIEGNEVLMPVVITEGEDLPEYDLILSKDTIMAGEYIQIYAWAPGLESMELDITWDRDPVWNDHRDSGAEYEVWTAGMGAGGEYPVTLTIHYPDREDEQIEKTLTVLSDGQLSDPILADIPSVLDLGNGINGSFQEIEGAEWYDVELWYVPDEGDWDQLYYERRDPVNNGAEALAFGSDYFDREGIYQVNVHSGAIGKDGGYAERQILVIDRSNTDPELILKVNEQEADAGEFVLNEGMFVTVDKPEGAVAARVWNGHYWEIWASSLDNWRHEDWSANEEGTFSFIAQATKDTSISDWETAYGNFDDFDWSQVNWSLTSNTVSFTVTCYGDLDVPQVTYPNGLELERGTDLVVSFEAVENADVYGVVVQEFDAYNNFWNDIYWAEYSEAGTYSILTDTLMAGPSYRVLVEPRSYGWRSHVSSDIFTISEVDWQDQEVFKFAKTDFLTNEDISVVVYVPGALEVILCGESIDYDPWLENHYGDSIAQSLRVITAGELTFLAFAKFEQEGEWVQIGEGIHVTATAPNGSLPITYNGAVYANAADGYTFTIEVEKKDGVWVDNISVFILDADYNEVIPNDPPEVTQTEDDEKYYVTYELTGSSLPAGTYWVDAYADVSVLGYEQSKLHESFILTDDNSKIETSLTLPNYFMTDAAYPFTVAAPGADRISVYRKPAGGSDDEYMLISSVDGDSLRDTVILASVEGDYQIKITAAYSDGSEFSRTFDIYVDAEFDDLWGPKIRMDAVWSEGNDLNFTVDHDMAKFIRVMILDPATGAEVFADADDNYGSREYSIPAALFTPGYFYDVVVEIHQESFNYNRTDFWLAMMPSSPETLILPPNLTEIQANAFNGISAQKIVIHDNVKSVGENAFSNCKNLLLVEIPADPKVFDPYAFGGSEPFMVYGTEAQEEFCNIPIPEATFIYLNQ